jgi:PAS domain-containing protein
LKKQYNGLVSPEGAVLYANGAALSLIGVRLDDVVGTPLWETPWHTETPGAPEAIRDLVERVAGSGETQSIDIILKMPDGVHRYDYSIRPIKNNSGDVISLTPEVNETPHVLTDREREVLSWTARGKTAGEIGSILSISARTIEWHIRDGRSTPSTSFTPSRWRSRLAS